MASYIPTLLSGTASESTRGAISSKGVCHPLRLPSSPLDLSPSYSLHSFVPRPSSSSSSPSSPSSPLLLLLLLPPSLDTNYQVKISDGALSQCFYQECYHAVRGTVRPVRWAAIETLQEGLCTSQSNVVSGGVWHWVWLQYECYQEV